MLRVLVSSAAGLDLLNLIDEILGEGGRKKQTDRYIDTETETEIERERDKDKE